MGERIEVHALNVIARRLFEKTIGPVKIASRETVIELLRPATAKVKFSLSRAMLMITSSPAPGTLPWRRTRCRRAVNQKCKPLWRM